MKFPQNSPYNSGKSQANFKVNQNRNELLMGARKADFQSQLLNSSLRFTLDERNNKMSYNNRAGGTEADMIYNIKHAKPSMPQAEAFDKQSKSHLTQMATNNAGQQGSSPS